MSNQEDNLAVSFRDADGANNIQRMIQYLDAIQSLDGIRRYKARTLELLPGTKESSALDIGCGLGDDVVRLKRRFGRAVGIDSSSRLITEAIHRHRSEGCEFHRSDATTLPFRDEEFDAARMDRSLQHMGKPVAVIREAARVVKKGGVVLCVEPDWGSVFIGTPFSFLTQAVEDCWSQNVKNPWMGRNLLSTMRTAGLTDLSVEAWTVLTQGFETSNLTLDIASNVRQLQAAGWNEPELSAWLEEYKKSEGLAGVTLMICRGRRT
jgi:ubiquinone/menaquinone biosynthesis C-methylase UbiE